MADRGCHSEAPRYKAGLAGVYNYSFQIHASLPRLQSGACEAWSQSLQAEQLSFKKIRGIMQLVIIMVK
jgi:hypothetical protein